MIKCSYCGKQITTAKYKTVKGKKYHYECYAEMTSKAKEVEVEKKINFSGEAYQKLINYIVELYSVKPIHQKVLKSTAQQEVERIINTCGYSYEGIYNSLVYYHHILGNDIYERVSIGIVPYIYDEAQEFFKNMKDVNEANDSRKIDNKKVVVKANQPDCKLSMIDVGEL